MSATYRFYIELRCDRATAERVIAQGSHLTTRGHVLEHGKETPTETILRRIEQGYAPVDVQTHYTAYLSKVIPLGSEHDRPVADDIGA